MSSKFGLPKQKNGAKEKSQVAPEQFQMLMTQKKRPNVVYQTLSGVEKTDPNSKFRIKKQGRDAVKPVPIEVLPSSTDKDKVLRPPQDAKLKIKPRNYKK